MTLWVRQSSPNFARLRQSSHEGAHMLLVRPEPAGGKSGRLNKGLSKQGVTTFAWRPGWQYDVGATRRDDSVLASDCHAIWSSFKKGWDVAFV